MARHALVLGSSVHDKPDPSVPAQPAQFTDTAFRSDSQQECVKLKSIYLAPRASAIKEQDFSETVAARIEAPQRVSTRSVYEVSGPFLQSGSAAIRLTSEHLL